MLSGRQKIERLGFDPDEFWDDVIRLDDLIMSNYTEKNLKENVYPYLKFLKKKYGFDIPINFMGLDVVRLDGVLSSLVNE